MSSLTFKANELKKLIKKFNDPSIKSELEQLVQDKGLVALVAQAIADNFRKEGPGWAPLKPQTIRQSIAKGLRGGLDARNNLAINKKGQQVKARNILRRSSLLMKSVTTPGGQNNIYRTEGTNLVWGTNLKYAAIHNYGGVIKHPGTKKGFGIKGVIIPPHEISIPKREFLVIRKEWKDKMNQYIMKMAKQIFDRHFS